MKIMIQILPLFALSLTLISCSGDSGGGSNPVPQEEQDTTGGTSGGTTTGGTSGGTTGGTSGGTTGGTSGGSQPNYDVTLDRELTSAERISVNNSVDLLESMKIDGSKTAYFSEIFGGNSSSNVVSYLENRVNYVVSQFTDLDSRVLYPSSIKKNLLETYALNPSVYIWYLDVIYSPEGVRFLVSGTPRNVNSSRVGVMQLGDIFTTSDAITQAITIVHEARHSDCPEGALASEIVRWYERLPPINHTCGQLHGLCPDGFNSCDVIPWGPYAIDFIYSLSIVNGCSSCTTTQTQQAQINANQVQGQAFDINGSMNGVYGPPDMSNSNQVRDDL